MTSIDVTFEALGQHWRVSGMFTPSRPAITAGPPDNWEPADPAVWDECVVTIDGTDTDLTDLLEHVRPMGVPGTALEYVQDVAETMWLRQQDEDRRAA